MSHRALIVLAVLCASSSVFAQDYEVRLDRPLTVGQRGRETGKISLHQKTFFVADGAETLVGERAMTVEYDIDWKVLEVGKLGGLKKIESTVRRFQKVGEAVDEELIAVGTRIVSRGEKTAKVHEADKGGLPEEALVVLNNTIHFEVDGVAPGDEVMGTKERKKVGETWAYNVPAAAKSMAALGMKVAEKDLSGEVKLASVGDRGGVRCMEIQTVLKVVKMALPQDGLPAGVKALSGAATVTSKTWLPLDKATPELGVEVNETLDFLYETPDGKVRTLTVVKRSWDAAPLK